MEQKHSQQAKAAYLQQTIQIYIKKLLKIIIKKAQVHPEYIRGVPGRYIGIRKGKISIIASDRAVAILDFEVSNKSKNEVKLLLKIGANASNEA